MCLSLSRPKPVRGWMDGIRADLVGVWLMFTSGGSLGNIFFPKTRARWAPTKCWWDDNEMGPFINKWPKIYIHDKEVISPKKYRELNFHPVYNWFARAHLCDRKITTNSEQVRAFWMKCLHGGGVPPRRFSKMKKTKTTSPIFYIWNE